MLFAWDERNIEHIGRHDVTQAEAEHVVRHAAQPWPQEKGDAKLMVWGPTDLGRLLQVIFVLKRPDEVPFESLTIDEWADLDEEDRTDLRDSCHGLDRGDEEALPQTAEIAMSKKVKQSESFEELEKLAQDVSDIRPLSRAARGQWEAALRTGSKSNTRRRKTSHEPGSRIVPISMDPALLEKVDRYASTAGISRSRLVAEALELRIGR